MIDRRTCLKAIMLGGVLTACAGAKKELSNRKKRSLFDAMMVVQASQTEAELLDMLGPPNGIGIFDPGNKSDPNYMNRYSRSEWRDLVVSVAPNLVDTLPARTRLLSYVFEYRPLVFNPTVGALEICIDRQGRILGYYYSKSLEGVEKRSGLRSRR